MKNIILPLLLIFSISIFTNAQNTVIPLFEGLDYAKTKDAYYKDIDNNLDSFLGTWVYTNTKEILIITLKKQQRVYFNYNDAPYYADYIYGEYSYTDKNGKLLVNTLANIDKTVSKMSQHLIFGNRLIPHTFPPSCKDCSPNERRLRLRIQDPERSYLKTNLVLRITPNHKNTMELQLTLSFSDIPEGAPKLPRTLSFNTIYPLVKQ